MNAADRYKAELEQQYKDGFDRGKMDSQPSIVDRGCGPKAWAYDAGFTKGRQVFERLAERVAAHNRAQ
jgi:hypothetical protein